MVPTRGLAHYLCFLLSSGTINVVLPTAWLLWSRLGVFFFGGGTSIGEEGDGAGSQESWNEGASSPHLHRDDNRKWKMLPRVKSGCLGCEDGGGVPTRPGARATVVRAKGLVLAALLGGLGRQETSHHHTQLLSGSRDKASVSAPMEWGDLGRALSPVCLPELTVSGGDPRGPGAPGQGLPASSH